VQLFLNRRDRRPLYLQVVEQIKDLIRSGALPAGSRLPPIRELATSTGLTRLTIHNAYAELQADGWIDSHVGRGSFVAREAIAAVAAVVPPVPSLMPCLPPPTGEFAEVMRLAQQKGITSFAQAAAAPSTFPLREWERTLHEVLANSGAALFDYGATQGETVLRDQLARFLLDRAVPVPPEQIVVTSGAQQGIDLVLRALTKPGDAVLVEQPTYLGMVERLALQHMRLVSVPLDNEGIDLEALERAIAIHRPRVLYTVPTFHNPTGISMSAARQMALLDLAQRHGVIILEDDVYGLLAYNGAASLPLKERDQNGQVIYLTSFSKVLMPGIRIGLLAAPPPLLEPLVAAKRLADMHSPQLLQHALALYLASGRFAAHVRGVVALYRERRDCMAQALRRSFPAGTHWTAPDGGLCFWVALPLGVRVDELYRAAIERGVAFTPGHVFFGEQPAQPHLRLSFAAHEPAAIEHGIAILGEVLHQHLARQRDVQHRSLCDVPMV